MITTKAKCKGENLQKYRNFSSHQDKIKPSEGEKGGLVAGGPLQWLFEEISWMKIMVNEREKKNQKKNLKQKRVQFDQQKKSSDVLLLAMYLRRI